MSVATAYEKERGAYVQDVSAGNDPRLREALERCGCARPSVASADIVSSLDHEIRIIEVKGRGSSGPITVIEREHETFSAAGPASWLYVVWNTTQPGPYRLITVQDPSTSRGFKLSQRNASPACQEGRVTRRSSSASHSTSSTSVSRPT